MCVRKIAVQYFIKTAVEMHVSSGQYEREYLLEVIVKCSLFEPRKMQIVYYLM